ncbi:MAG: hypothetical protein GXP48_06115 [Acidobacteria bacterium]|nr:hypothetical protein [Acidobacteriota bacterium]
MRGTNPDRPDVTRNPGERLVTVPLAVAAATCGLAAAGLAVFSGPAVRVLLGLSLPIFPGGAPAGYYVSRLRWTALGWAVLGPAFLIASSVSWRWLTGPGRPLSGSPRQRKATVLLLVALVLAGTNLLPRQRTGDEPAYIAVAHSIWRDHDIEVPEIGDLLHPSPAALLRGEAISRHAPGMSLLLAAPLALLGEAGVRLTTAALGICFILVLMGILGEHMDDERAPAVALLVGITFPVVTFAGLVFPDLAAALVFAVLYRSIIQERGHALLPALAIGAIVWFNSRYVLPAVFLGGWELLRSSSRLRRRWEIPGALATSLGLMAWLHLRWFGSPSPFAAWHGMPHLVSWSNLIPGTLGVLVDQQYGALVWAPILLLFPVGFVILSRRNVREAAAVVLLGGLTIGPGILHDWSAGWSPAARFFVPLLGPLMLLAGLGLVFALDGGRLRRAAAGIIIAGQLAIGFLAAAIPGKVFGTFEAAPHNYFLDLLGRAAHFDTTWILPSIRASQATPTLIHATILGGLWLLFCGFFVRARAR